MSVVPFPTLPPRGTEADQPLRVLRPDLSRRIACVEQVRRQLKRAGIRVVSQDLLSGTRPSLVVEAGSEALRRTACYVRAQAGVVTAVIGDVAVRWPEKAAP